MPPLPLWVKLLLGSGHPYGHLAGADYLKNLFTDPGIRDPPCRACRAPSALLRHVLRSLLCLPVCAPRGRERETSEPSTEPNGGHDGGATTAGGRERRSSEKSTARLIRSLRRGTATLKLNLRPGSGAESRSSALPTICDGLALPFRLSILSKSDTSRHRRPFAGGPSRLET